MGDWQDWNGDGKVTNEERDFSIVMLDDAEKLTKKNGGCFTCILLCISIPTMALAVVQYFC